MIKVEQASVVRSRKRSEAGISLFEVIAAMLMLSVIGALAVPSITSLMDSFNKSNAELQIVEDLRRAQATSVKEGCRGIFTFAADGESYTYGCDYAPFSAANPPPIEKNIFSHQLPAKITISADGTIIFNTRGQVVDYLGALDSRTLTMRSYSEGTLVDYNVGVLRPTGFLSFEQ